MFSEILSLINKIFALIQNSGKAKWEQENLSIEKANPQEKHKNRSTFIFLFGSAGSGKSTLGASLCYYVQISKKIRLELNLDNVAGHRYYIENWLDKIKNNQFPARTLISTVEEIDIALRTQDSSALPFAFTFIEMAGEHFSTIDPNNINIFKNEFQGGVLSYIDRANIIFLVVDVSEKKYKEDDLLIALFLQHLEGRINKGHTIHKKHIYLILSKWDLAVNEYGNDTKRFIQANLPSINSYIEVMENIEYPTKIIKALPFSVGEIKTNTEGTPFINEYNDAYIKEIWTEIWKHKTM